MSPRTVMGIPVRMMDHREYLALRRFPALDGLRAIAALLVFAFHFGGRRFAILSGWIGVTTFFVLSGFLITTLALREESRNGRMSLRDFYIRRVFRIMPVYYVIFGLTVGYVVYLGAYRALGYDRALWHYLTFFCDFRQVDLAVHFWSIGIEQKFYLFWPLLAFAVSTAAMRRGRLGVAIIAMLGCAAIGFGGTGWMIHYVSLLLGCTLAVVMHHPRGFAVVRPLTHPYAAIAVGAVVTIAHLGIAPVLNHHLLNELQVIVGYATATAVLLPTLLGPTPTKWVLALPPLKFVGERSYSLYLIQGLVGAVVVRYLHPATASSRLFLVTAASLVVAHLLYHLVEKPGIRLGRTIISRLPDRRTPAGAPTGLEVVIPAQTRRELASVPERLTPG